MLALRALRTVVLAVLACASAGCHESGSWSDDPGNWKRALMCEQPAGVEVLRSWVWRSPHWTSEYEWYFELRSDAALAPIDIVDAGLRPASVEEADAALGWLASPPEWFAPLELAEYEAWIATRPGHGNLVLLVERGTGRVFLGNCLM